METGTNNPEWNPKDSTMESKHTPGPWHVVTLNDFGKYHLLSSTPEHAEGFNLLDEDDFDCASANAQLASCAPEMLEALGHARDQIKDFIMIAAPLGESFDKTEERFHNNVTLREIESVLAKAKGGKQ